MLFESLKKKRESKMYMNYYCVNWNNNFKKTKPELKINYILLLNLDVQKSHSNRVYNMWIVQFWKTHKIFAFFVFIGIFVTHNRILFILKLRCSQIRDRKPSKCYDLENNEPDKISSFRRYLPQVLTIDLSNGCLLKSMPVLMFIHVFDFG